MPLLLKGAGLGSSGSETVRGRVVGDRSDLGLAVEDEDVVEYD